MARTRTAPRGAEVRRPERPSGPTAVRLMLGHFRLYGLAAVGAFGEHRVGLGMVPGGSRAPQG